MLDTERAWLAGLLEGEGCFGVYSFARGSKTYLNFAISLRMTDEDVVRRAQRVAGVGRVYGPASSGGSHKDAWTWNVNRRAEVRDLLLELLPWMGTRRSARFHEILAVFEPDRRVGQRSEEHRNNISAALKGRSLSADHKAKISASLIARKTRT